MGEPGGNITPEQLARWDRAPHGTRTRYVRGCRCDACREANTAAARERQQRLVAAAAEVTPSGPPIESTLERGGKLHRVLRCPGGEGDPCVSDPPTWLRKGDVCRACVARHTVWNGTVPCVNARRHIRNLQRHGVGLKAIEAASDVPRTTLCAILREDRAIRADTERRILEVDAGAIADHAVIDAGPTRRRIEQLQARGFTLEQLAELYGTKRVLQVGIGPRVLAVTAHRIERIWQRAQRGEIEPALALVDAEGERAWIDEMRDRGLPRWWIEERLGFAVRRGARGKMHRRRRDAIRELRDELAALSPGELDRVAAVLRRRGRRG